MASCAAVQAVGKLENFEFCRKKPRRVTMASIQFSLRRFRRGIEFPREETSAKMCLNINLFQDPRNTLKVEKMLKCIRLLKLQPQRKSLNVIWLLGVHSTSQYITNYSITFVFLIIK